MQNSRADEPLSDTRKTFTLDVDACQTLLDGVEASDEEKQHYLEAVWNIIVAFVELGFAVEPQQNHCGKAASDVDLAALDAPDLINCVESQITKNKSQSAAASLRPDRSKESA